MPTYSAEMTDTKQTKRVTAGRRERSPAARSEQLRNAKRAQRLRQRVQGIVQVELLLPQVVANKLVVARRDPGFAAQLDKQLDRSLVRLNDYPQLRDIAWNRTDTYVPAREAFALYERNWRFIDLARMNATERALLNRLAEEFGNGVINA